MKFQGKGSRICVLLDVPRSFIKLLDDGVPILLLLQASLHHHGAQLALGQ